MIILLIGPQGSGKGTEGKLLSESLNLPLIGVGELLRNTPSNHPKYSLIMSQLKNGNLVDYESTAHVIKDRVALHDCINGYILDGWGRILDQLPFFDPNPDVVLYFNVPLEETIKRIAGRRICETTGEVMNIHSSSKEDLDRCKDHLIIRTDDTEEVVLKRQHKFDTETIPVVEYYKTKGKVVEVDGLGTVQEVHMRTLKALEINQLKN
jgi:adenylate kinase